jgi:membrane fusion protein (multidrug efflux system)
MPEPAAEDPEARPPAGGAKIHELPGAKGPPPAERAAPAPLAAIVESRPARSRLRPLLLALGPIVLIAVALPLYLSGGRYVSTDNAYVRADKLNISSEIAGSVASIAVRESQQVTRGQPLFRLDDEPYRIALASAEAQLGAARNEIMTLQATYRLNMAQIEQARIDVAFYDAAFQRQLDLSKRGVATQSAFDQAKRDLDAAKERVIVAQRSADTALAQLGGDAAADIAANPRVRQAQALIDRARRDLSRAVIVAPMDGIVTNVAAVQIGQYLPAAQPALSIVGTADIWIDANPKETDLTALRAGNPARVTIDAYPGREWRASVASISPATGAEFSVLPAQNASGNWVKVVQRVPVRLRVERAADGPPLRAGMSANVEIDTGEVRTLSGVAASIRHAVGF